MTSPSEEEFEFDFEPRVARANLVFGVTPTSTHIVIRDGQLLVEFGFWSSCTQITNIRRATVTGPYRWWRIAGPARFSVADRGVTFATTTRQGVCLDFHQPVRAIEPTGTVRHPTATITVAEPAQFLTALHRGGVETAEHPVAQRPAAP